MAKRMAKNEFCIKQRHIFRLITEKKTAFLIFHACAQAKILTFYLRIYFDLSLSLSFFLFLSSILAVFCPLYRLFLHRIVTSQIFGKGKNFDLQRVADKPAHWQWIFP